MCPRALRPSTSLSLAISTYLLRRAWRPHPTDAPSPGLGERPRAAVLGVWTAPQVIGPAVQGVCKFGAGCTICGKCPQPWGRAGGAQKR